MSDLLNQASLVMVPSGYKEDTVYSVVPSDGSGDLAFTRASNGTRINSAGLVEVCPWNLAQYSEDFAQAPPIWNKYQATITSNTTTAPNGTLTADSIIDNSANDVHIAYQDRAGIVAGTYTISAYAKASTLSHINLQWYDGTTFYTSNAFNLSNGTTTGANQSIESVGNGWYRCIFTFTTTVSGTQYAYVMTNNGTSNVYIGTGQSVFIWGYQLNIGSTAKPYFPTTDRLNVPRLTYQNGGGGCPSLLLEKQSTNISNQSQDFASWPTQVNVTPTANYATSPDGTQNASRLQFTGAGFMYGANGYSQTSGVVYTLSCWAKRNGSGSQSVGFFVDGSGSINSAWSLSSEYQRFTYTYTAGNSSLVGIAGASGADVSVWGWQFEASSYPTSYIPTTSSSATRVADACFKTGISSLIGQTEGVLFADVTLTTRQSFSYISISNAGSSANYVGIYFRAAGIELEVVNGGVLQGNVIYSNSSTGRFKIAGAYKANDFVLYVNGTQIGTDTSGTIPTCNYLDLFGFGDAQPFQNNQTALFPTRLTNAELASLTTI